MIIFGESFFNLKSAKNLFNLFKNFLLDNNKFSNEWNPINILSTDASRVGNFDLDIVDETNQVLKNLNENKYEIIFLLRSR